MNDTSDRTRDKTRRIRDAAEQVFAEAGFRRARIRDVAERAGVAEGTIYLYFKGKEDLLLSIFEARMEELIHGVREAVAAADSPQEQLRAFARFHFSQVERNRAVAEVLQVELRLSHKFLKAYRPTHLWTYLSVIGDILDRGREAGCFRADLDPHILRWAFFGALDELAMQWVLARPARRFSVDHAARQVADTFLQGVVLVDPTRSQPQEAP